MYLVHLSHSGPEWDIARPMEEQTEWLAHAAYMDSLVDQGSIVLGGPLDDMRVVLVFEAESEQAVRELLGRDPWSGSHLRITAVEPWTIRLDGRRLAADR
ncbi:YciI family protein [Micromonospora sp. NPDC049559]|uniref:YciI family protein n=1 Tax=Micromonospora sp. NPDC049559 TaxID=3155923 RepID=UPI00341B6D0C